MAAPLYCLAIHSSILASNAGAISGLIFSEPFPETMVLGMGQNQYCQLGESIAMNQL